MNKYLNFENKNGFDFFLKEKKNQIHILCANSYILNKTIDLLKRKRTRFML